MSDFVGTRTMNMLAVRGDIKPWTAKDGSVRYYVNNLFGLLDDYRAAIGCRGDTSYDWANMRASPARVRQIIEGNILPNTKAFIDAEGHVHVYGWAAHGAGERMGLPESIEMAIDRRYGYCSETERIRRLSRMMRDYHLYGKYAKVGDTVLITSGRKEQGKEFVVAKVTYYSYSQYRDPSVYLHAEDGFKVSADYCDIIDLGYAYDEVRA